MEQFSISTGVREGFQVLVVRGELDELTAPELDLKINGHRNGQPVVVDLTETEFMSSAGLHVLLRDRPERIALVCPPGSVMQVLELVRADLRLPIFSDLDTAIQNLTPSQSTHGQITSASHSRHKLTSLAFPPERDRQRADAIASRTASSVRYSSNRWL